MLTKNQPIPDHAYTPMRPTLKVNQFIYMTLLSILTNIRWYVDNKSIKQFSYPFWQRKRYNKATCFSPLKYQSFQTKICIVICLDIDNNTFFLSNLLTYQVVNNLSNHLWNESILKINCYVQSFPNKKLSLFIVIHNADELYIQCYNISD